MLTLMRHKNERTYGGGGRDGNCNHGLSRGLLTARNLLRVELESKSDDGKNGKKKERKKTKKKRDARIEDALFRTSYS